MESPFTPNMAGSPFYFYTPESQPDQRQLGHFSPQAAYPTGMPFYPVLIRNPGVNYVQQYPPPDASMATVFQNAVFPPQKMMTPLASPQPLYHRPAFIERRSPFLQQLDTQLAPQTPPLSSSGSASSSPPTAYPLLATPSNRGFALPEPMYGAKFDADAFGEVIPQPEWMSPSPPHTPVFVFPSAVPTRTSATSVVALKQRPISPSPSPLQSSKPAVESAVTFCDPRELTVQSPVVFGLPTPLTYSPLGEDNKGFPFVGGATSLDFIPAPASDFLGTTGLYGLDFDNEFTNFSKSGFSDDAYFTSNKRQKTELVAFPHEDETFLTEDSFSETEDDQLASAWLITPSDLDHSFRTDMSTSPTSSQNSIDSGDVDSEGEYVAHSTAENGTHTTPTEQTSSNVESNRSGSEGAMDQGNDDDASSTSPAINRRGRKQSLTDDPSKTFICTLCNRRFRRQEHLKRHYRSLHTHDKPFKCGDCGKVFSRSDNLAQHQRTHGIGTIALEMNGLGDGEGDSHHGAASPESDSDRMAQILYQAAQRLTTSTTPESSSSGSEESEISVTAATTEKKARKRKRDE